MIKISHLLCTTALAFLTACSGDDVRSTIGLERNAPDEFRVVSRPPLSVPPEFSLRPPLAGEDEVAALPADKLTRSMITGTSTEFTNPVLARADGTPMVDTAVMPVESGNAPSGAESELLSKLGADRKESDIRDKIFSDRIEQKKAKDEEWLSVDSLNPFAKEKDVLDAKQEVQALKEEGKPVMGQHLVLREEKKEPTAAPETVVPAVVEKAPEPVVAATPPATNTKPAGTPMETKPSEPVVVVVPEVKNQEVKVENKVETQEENGSLINLSVPDKETINDDLPEPEEAKPIALAPEKKPENKVEAPVAKPASGTSASGAGDISKMPKQIIIKGPPN